MNPQYSEKYLGEYYSAYTVDEPWWEEPLLYCHDYYLSIIEKFTTKGKLLDVGAGKGYLMQAAMNRGWDVEGYEIDYELTKKLADKYKVKMFGGDFASLSIAPESYNAVTMHQVIEHLKDPKPYLTKINNILKPGGVLFLVQPNICSRSAIFKFTLEKLGLKKKNIGAYYDTSHHLFFYTPKTLKKMVERFGFNVVFTKSGHPARPKQSAFKRWWLRNFSDRLLWKSTFMAVCVKE
jgi:2-polyprenyl-3-methyl-5-hydroxy-6-metoxy-1,4-benzoquinol methylase